MVNISGGVGSYEKQGRMWFNAVKQEMTGDLTSVTKQTIG